MKLILIHGIAQEKFDEADLKQTWIKNLQMGLAKSGLSLPPETEVVFPYYGKMLAQLAAEAKNAPDPTKPVNRNEQIFDENAQMEFEIAFLREILAQSTLDNSEKRKLEVLLEPKRGVVEKALTWDWVHQLVKKLDAQPELAKYVLSFVKTAYAYLWNHEVQDTIHKYIKKYFDTQKPCVVVGHSLGSVISYMVLHAHPSYKVRKLITIGSPLGTKTVQNHLKPSVSSPKCIKKGWFNAFDKRDIVALYPLDEMYFKIKPLIENYAMVHNTADNAHGIEDYLQDERVAKTIYDALQMV